MLIKNIKHSHRFKPYFFQNSILIQFIFFEFILTHKKILKIKFAYIEKKKLSLPTSWKNLFFLFNELVGFPYQEDRPPLSYWIKGPFAKLKSYVFHYAKNDTASNKIPLQLLTNLHALELSIIRMIELLKIFEEKMADNKLINRQIHKEIKLFFETFEEIIEQIPKMIIPYLDNENLLLFLFRKKESIQQIFGVDFLKTLKRYHSMKKFVNSKDLLEQMVKRYTKRGFAHLANLIKSHE